MSSKDLMLYTLKRLLNIIWVTLKYGIDRHLFPKFLAPSLLIAWVPKIRQKHKLLYGEKLFYACCELGPLFVKMGQMVSIRHDLFDYELIEPLTKLQDQVPPFDNQLGLKAICDSLKKPIDQLFQSIDPTPLASASIAQVYQAQLLNGDDVIVKVLRPNIRQTLTIDIKLLKCITKVICLLRLRSSKTFLALIDEYRYTLFQEINLKHEACHYSQMRHHFEHDARLYVPKIYWSHTTSDIMTVERIRGIAIDEIPSDPSINRKQLAYNGVSIFFTQVFKHRFFHADMHPGNVFVDITQPDQPKYMAVDFGIVGVLSPTDQYYLAESFLGFYKKDYTRIAQLHIEAGWVCRKTDIVKFETAIRHVCEPIFSRTIEEISIAELMQRLVEVSKPFDLNIQPQLLMLQKTLFHVEALGRSLYPKLNLWEAVEPFMAEFMKERSSYKTGWSQLKKELPRIMMHSPELPYLIAQKLRAPHINPHDKINDKTSKNQRLLPLTRGVVAGALLANPIALTNPGVVYILGSCFIIMMAWKTLR
ncbi:MAG: AarF/UbiB family protein [Pseudomonadota bacterium]|nr:AarF/UbiB family protein [Pseudomonadota bacterium]